MKILVLLLLSFASAFGHAQGSAWQPTPGHTQLALWPGTPPDARSFSGAESTVRTGKESLVAGKPWTSVEHVSRPTITLYSPARNTSGAAVLVFPGGGYQVLAIDLEGTEVCDWLVSRGIACVLLKYRVPAPRSAPYWGAYPASSIALEDAQRAISLVRAHSSDWHFDPHKIGVLGFSAGGHLVVATSVHFTHRVYPAIDDVDKQSCRPDFAVALYPGHLSGKRDGLRLNPDIAAHITPTVPPTFLLQNEDDPVDPVENSLSYYLALKSAGVPVELHSFSKGGHAFGLRRTDSPATSWPVLVERWLTTIGVWR